MFKEISTKKSKEIEAILSYNLKYEMETEKVDGKSIEKMKMLNPDQSIENAKRAEEALVEEFKGQLDQERKDKIENSRNEYDDFKAEIFDYATENAIMWIINLGLCPEHQAIKSLIDDKPSLNTYRTVKKAEEFKKWVEDGTLEKKQLELIKEKNKKK